MTKRKMALFLPSLAGGGAERVMLSLADEFAQQGCDVDLVLGSVTGEYVNQVPSYINVVDLKSSRVLFSLFPLVRYLKKQKPQSVLAALEHANIVAICAVALANIQTKTVVSIHSNLSQYATLPGQRRIVKWLPRLMKWSFQRADKVVAVSEGVAEDVRQTLQLPAEKVQVIYNPVVDAELIQKAAEPVDHPWFREGAPPVVLAVGRLTEAKDYPNLIQAFAKLRQTREAKLIILGEGEKREELEQLIKQLGLEQDAALPGFVANPYAYMKQAQLFVLSSNCEGLPTVLIEALACGTKVVSTDCPSGPREILANGKYGPLVPIENSEALFQAMQQELEQTNTQTNQEAYEPFWKTNVSRQYLEIL